MNMKTFIRSRSLPWKGRGIEPRFQPLEREACPSHRPEGAPGARGTPGVRHSAALSGRKSGTTASEVETSGCIPCPFRAKSVTELFSSSSSGGRFVVRPSTYQYTLTDPRPNVSPMGDKNFENKIKHLLAAALPVRYNSYAHSNATKQ